MHETSPVVPGIILFLGSDMKQKILSLAGDGIGQEVVPVSIEILKAVT